MPRAITAGRRGARIAVAVAAALLALYVLLAAVAIARAPPSELEDALGAAGVETTRAVGSPAIAASRARTTADLIVLDGTRPLLEVERAALERFVERGGTLWILSTRPEASLWPLASGPIVASPGFVFEEDGSPGSFAVVRGEGASFSATGMRRLALPDMVHEPLILSGPTSFRDSNGNERLDVGEPAGPFLVGAAFSHGEGRVVIVATADAGALPAATITEWATDAGVGRAVLAAGATPAWTQPAATSLRIASLLSLSWAAALALGLGALAALFLALDPAPASRAQRSWPALVQALEREWPTEADPATSRILDAARSAQEELP